MNIIFLLLLSLTFSCNNGNPETEDKPQNIDNSKNKSNPNGKNLEPNSKKDNLSNHNSSTTNADDIEIPKIENKLQNANENLNNIIKDNKKIKQGLDQQNQELDQLSQKLDVFTNKLALLT
ncbi:MAG: hypothetical protein GY830_03775 [Bacteroidetes bacterium]|nr:hypothetical protein [Bacteroidota bacterium]